MPNPMDDLTMAPDLRVPAPRSDGPPVNIVPGAGAIIFDGVSAHCTMHGVANIALTAARIGVGSDGKLAFDEVMRFDRVRACCGGRWKFCPRWSMVATYLMIWRSTFDTNGKGDTTSSQAIC